MVRADDGAGVAGLWCRCLELFNPLPHEPGEPRILRVEIALLERIGLEIVQLWPRCSDQFGLSPRSDRRRLQPNRSGYVDSE